jgi:hypothetical protein
MTNKNFISMARSGLEPELPVTVYTTPKESYKQYSSDKIMSPYYIHGAFKL